MRYPSLAPREGIRIKDEWRHFAPVEICTPEVQTYSTSLTGIFNVPLLYQWAKIQTQMLPQWNPSRNIQHRSSANGELISTLNYSNEDCLYTLPISFPVDIPGWDGIDLWTRLPRHSNNSMCRRARIPACWVYNSPHLAVPSTHPITRIEAEGVPPVYEVWGDVK